jgi:hypothetical protein
MFVLLLFPHVCSFVVCDMLFVFSFTTHLVFLTEFDPCLQVTHGAPVGVIKEGIDKPRAVIVLNSVRE